MSKLTNKKIILGVTGSIAAYKSPEIVRLLRQEGAEVRVIITEGGTQFITPLTLQAVSNNIVRQEMFSVADERTIEHIELAKWADLILIAPATAGIAARICQATAADLLSTVCLATTAPIVLVPAMNNNMWQNAAVKRNFAQLQQDGVQILGPVKGELACGDTDIGKMMAPQDIVKNLREDFANE